MHPTRRRKKRPSYGVRTVEVQRGASGFGFTISGQAPCLLSCIVSASPADAAGLRPGDYLLAVNGQNVATSLHDDVVQLIGSTQSTLRLQIAENYYTDSSEDETCVASRSKHKLAHRARHRHGAARGRSLGDSWGDEEPARGAAGPPPPPRDPQGFLQPTAPAVRPVRRVRPGPNQAGAAATGGGERLLITEQAVNGLIYPTLQELQRERQQEAEPALFGAVVGYLGTIEMPKEKDLAGSRLQAIRNCIRRLRVEKKVHTLVMMSVFPSRVSLSNTHGWALATYPADRITFCGIYADDKRFFGLVTVHRHDDPSDQSQDESSPPPISSSCHVFMVDPKLAAHGEHAKRARAFGLQCSAPAEDDGHRCQGFPETAEPILQAILSLYQNRVLPGMADPELQPATPPHSNTSSNSSNSDSGIGFRDDGHTGERIFVVDVERERLRIHRVVNQGGMVGPPPPPPGAGRHAERRMPSTLQHSNSCRSSECSFVRSLEDLRGATGPGCAGGDSGGCDGGGRLAAPRLWHGSDTELARIVTGYEARPFVRSLERRTSEVRTEPGGRATPTTSAAADQEQRADLEPEAKQRWTKGQSFRRLNRRALSPPPPSPCRGTAQPPAAEADPQLAKACGNGLEAVELGCQADSASGQSESAAGAGGSSEEGLRAAGWASSFERLIEDPAGLHTFAEFLKSQFSHENIYFWVACERYKRLSEAEERRQVALQIFERHLCVGAPEPVNVDSQAQQAAQDAVDQAPVTLFDKAQQQIFSLMKLDCYPRFLKAAIYTSCVSREVAGQQLPYQGGDALDPDLRLQPDKKKPNKKGGKTESDERRRKSLLPWHRKDRSKSKDRGEADYKRKKRQREREESVSVRSDLSGSRSSLASAELAHLQRSAVSRESLHAVDQPAVEPECLLCRVLLPDSSSAVVQAAAGDSVRVILQRLLERRGLPYNSWDVYLAKSDRPLDQSVDSCWLGCKEIRMEQRVLFRLDLPNQKTIGVKAKPSRQTCEVLRPILSKYGCQLDDVHLFEWGGGAPLDTKVPVTRLDNRHLVVRYRDDHGPVCPSLDEITNRVFDDLLKGKADGTFDDFGVIDLDQNSGKTEGGSSERSAPPLASLVRRNSVGEVRRAHHHHPAADARTVGPPPPPLASLVDGKETDVALYEGLKRAQMCRLDDQRGTEINFELPEFLRKREAVQNKENYRPERLSAPVMARRPACGAPDSRLSMMPAGWRSSRQLAGVLPTDQQADHYFRSELAACGRLSLGLSDGGQLDCPPMPRRGPEQASPPDALHPDDADFSPPAALVEAAASSRPRLATAAAKPPPPLPPKPSVALRGPPPRPPVRSVPAQQLAAGRSRKAIYLDKAERLNISFV